MVQWVTIADITSNDPHFDVPYNAQGNPVNGIFYYESGNANLSYSAWNNAPGSWYTDIPGSRYANFQWSAQATLVGINPDGTLMPLVSATYGYTAAGGVVTPSPVTFSANPLSYVQTYINNYNASKSGQ
ncbi:MAG TPA: hypothetical protein VGS79_00315 [Puia sp.]|nr:hypothetical protein [Puia sp.]